MTSARMGGLGDPCVFIITVDMDGLTQHLDNLRCIPSRISTTMLTLSMLTVTMETRMSQLNHRHLIFSVTWATMY